MGCTVFLCMNSVNLQLRMAQEHTQYMSDASTRAPKQYDEPDGDAPSQEGMGLPEIRLADDLFSRGAEGSTHRRYTISLHPLSTPLPPTPTWRHKSLLSRTLRMGADRGHSHLATHIDAHIGRGSSHEPRGN